MQWWNTLATQFVVHVHSMGVRTDGIDIFVNQFLWQHLHQCLLVKVQRVNTPEYIQHHHRYLQSCILCPLNGHTVSYFATEAMTCEGAHINTFRKCEFQQDIIHIYHRIDVFILKDVVVMLANRFVNQQGVVLRQEFNVWFEVLIWRCATNQYHNRLILVVGSSP